MSSAVRTITKSLLLVTIVAGMFLGCATRSRVVVRTPRAKVVVIKKGHAHTKRCGHYRYNDRWYYVKGHAHGSRCGHLKVRGIWIIK